jgi:cyclic-di-AMP phosphodiesterase PgpH
LAEAAADAIGANSLLVRVGAYYHDIGKMLKPEYFTENQIVPGNKHDQLEPSMSRLVILNHVKEGVELAQKYKLNQKIIDFIPQHHGTSLIHYFYQKAISESESENVEEENYRYPGPKPQTKETAIVLLADSVEGATRSLDEHTPQKIEDVVRKIINNKFIDGQLDECNLTLREIDTIASTFMRVLSAMYHSRIKYPEQKG